MIVKVFDYHDHYSKALWQIQIVRSLKLAEIPCDNVHNSVWKSTLERYEGLHTLRKIQGGKENKQAEYRFHGQFEDD